MKKTTDTEYAKILYGLTQKPSKHIDEPQKICDVYIRFLSNRRVLHRLPRILNQYITYAKRQEGTTDISFATKREFPNEYTSDIHALVGDNASVHRTVNQKLLGGVLVKMNNVMYDATVNAKLHSLQTQLLKTM